MPYDNEGRWVPPSEAVAGDWDDYDDVLQVEQDILSLTGENEPLTGGIKTPTSLGDYRWGESIDRLRNLYDTDAWKSLSSYERSEFMQMYQNAYHGTEDGQGWTDTFKYEAEWGLGFKRVGNSDLDDDDDWSTIEKFRYMMGLKGDESKIDYAHYNNNNLYRATIDDLYKSGQFNELSDYRTNFTSARQLRAAKKIISQWSKPEEQSQIEWAEANAVPYNQEETDAQTDFAKFNITRHFDPETNMTTYLNIRDNRELGIKLEEARQLGNYTQLKEPATPQNLNIISGIGPTPQYNSDGDQIVDQDAVRVLYQRYLGRDYNNVQDITDGTTLASGKGIAQWELDYWVNSAGTNNWGMKEVEDHIRNSGEAAQNVDKGLAYFNPNAGKESAITSKIVDKPADITPPSLTIRKIDVKRPSNIDSNWNVRGVS